MKTVKRILKISVSVFLTSVLAVSVYTCASVPKLSRDTKQVIDTVMDEPIPEIVKGTTGYAHSQEWKIWYERIPAGDTIKGTVLLIMGAANDALSWPRDFISHFTDAGYQVIRYDHRGTGLTESKEGWDRKNPYTLNDLAKDPIAILDTLHIQKAHLVGVSMGGMIAQVASIKQPERFSSLTSIMSSANVFDTLLPSMNMEILPKMISAVIKHGMFGGKEGKIKLQVVQKK
ncbi:MAG: alpha/beta fold hydrolase, partial [Pricia sp.]|nr:alpha/beta fold hydrolase [Pricia sp.]